MKSIKAIVNNNTLELKNIRFIDGHNDTVPFTSTIYFNDKYIGKATNDGRGADAVILVDDNIDETTKKEWDNFCAEVKEITYIISLSEQKFKIKYDINFICDCMAFQSLTMNNKVYNWGI